MNGACSDHCIRRREHGRSSSAPFPLPDAFPFAAASNISFPSIFPATACAAINAMNAMNGKETRKKEKGGTTKEEEREKEKERREREKEEKERKKRKRKRREPRERRKGRKREMCSAFSFWFGTPKNNLPTTLEGMQIESEAQFINCIFTARKIRASGFTPCFSPASIGVRSIAHFTCGGRKKGVQIQQHFFP